MVIAGVRTLSGQVNWYRVFSWVLVIGVWALFLLGAWGWATNWKWVVRW